MNENYLYMIMISIVCVLLISYFVLFIMKRRIDKKYERLKDEICERESEICNLGKLFVYQNAITFIASKGCIFEDNRCLELNRIEFCPACFSYNILKNVSALSAEDFLRFTDEIGKYKSN